METPKFRPYCSDASNIPELTWPALLLGAVLGVVFGASSLYLVLKVGLTVSASIPVAVLSITIFRGFSRLTGLRRATILENNIVQTTGSAGESIAFGVGVTMPALMILGYDMELARVMIVASLGGLLGVLMMIPLRRAFIVKQHGVLAYPEGRACADVLISGEQGGATAQTVFTGFGVAAAYKFLMSGLKLWKEVPERALGFFKGAAISGEVAPELLGVGYIIGFRVSCVMAAGGILSSWVIIPAIKLFGEGLQTPLFPADRLIRDMSPAQIWKAYVLYIGAGAVAAGGIISLLQALPTIVSSLKSGLADLAKERGGGPRLRRTEKDLSNRFVLFGGAALVLLIAAAPGLGLGLSLRGILGAALLVFFGFLFVTVSSRITGEIGSSSNPISGMTVATLLLTCLIFVLMGHLDPEGGWMGKGARLTALSIAAVVCVAASNGGTTSQDLKTGFLVGATPRSQQLALLVGSLTSALVIGWTLLVLNDAGTVYARRDYPAIAAPASALGAPEAVRGPDAASDAALYRPWLVGQGEVEGLPAGKYLVADDGHIRYLVDPGINGTETRRSDGSAAIKYNAPKARLMSLIIDGILTKKLPWGLVLLGVAIALVMELCGVPSLAFAVGVYLPLSTSTPILAGGLARRLADSLSGKGEKESDMSPGVLLSSGYIAGGAIAGILVALVSVRSSVAKALDFSGLGAWTDSDPIALLIFCALAAFLVAVGAEKLMKPKHGAGGV